MKIGHPEVTKRARMSVSSLDEETRSFDAIASTEAIDSHGERVKQDWKLDRYKANPVVFFGHQSWDLPIGKASDVRVEEGQLRMRVTLLSAAANPLAEQVFQSMREGALTGVSVGFKRGKRTTENVNGREVVTLSENELLELSIVGVPANPEARAKDGRHGVGAITETTMKNIVTKALDLSKDASDEAIERTLDQTITDILGATGAKSLAGVAGAVEKLKLERQAHAEKAAKFDKLEADTKAAKEREEKDAAASKLAATIDAAVKAGKITPARKAEYQAKAEKHGQEWIESVIEALPVQGGTLEDAAGAGADTSKAKSEAALNVAVDAELKRELERVGLTEEDYRRTAAEMRAKGLS